MTRTPPQSGAADCMLCTSSHTQDSGVAGGGVCVVSVEGRGSGEKIFRFPPKIMRFCKISCARKITKQKNCCRERLKTFFKKACVWWKDRREAQNV